MMEILPVPTLNNHYGRTKVTGQNEGTWGFEYIRGAIKKDVKPFAKTLKEYIQMFDEGLAKEITEMKDVLNQMETKVDKCSVERKCFENKKKELLLENDCLLKHILYQYVMCIAMHADVEINCVVPTNDNNLAYAEMKQSYIHEYSKVLELETELSKKKDMVEKDAPAFPKFFEINKLKPQLQKKNTIISNLKDHIATLKAKSVSDCVVQVNNSLVIDPGMYKLDLPPLYLELKINKEVHVDYLKQEEAHADTLRAIIEQARALKPQINA
nr:hypothetical protein [Tanacetum cinerariifolium]